MRAALGTPTARPGRGQPWKYLRQRSAPRVTARRCPMRRTPSRRRQFEGRPLAGALGRGRVDGCIRSRRPAPRGADELVGAPAKPLLRARRCQKLKHKDGCPKGWSLTPLRRCVCNAASIRETLSRPDAIHTQVGRNAHRLLRLPRALPSRCYQGPSSACTGGESLSFDAQEGLLRSVVPDKGATVSRSEILRLAGTHSLNGPLHVRSTMEREVDVATFAPNAMASN